MMKNARTLIAAVALSLIACGCATTPEQRLAIADATLTTATTNFTAAADAKIITKPADLKLGQAILNKAEGIRVKAHAATTQPDGGSLSFWLPELEQDAADALKLITELGGVAPAKTTKASQ